MGTVTEFIEKDPNRQDELLSLSTAQIEALLEVVALAIYADGVVAVEELEVFGEVARELPMLSQISESDLDEQLRRATAKLRRITDPSTAAESLARIAKQLGDNEAREAAFGVAAVIIMSDGSVVQPEKNVLNRLAQAFAIPLERLQAIVAEAHAFLEER